MDDELIEAATALLEICRKNGDLKIATAESCTGGLISAALTAIAGSSAWFERGFVTYSNQAKTELLDVPAELIARLGAVSQDVAIAMAEGAVRNAPVEAALAVTGIAGPDGGSPDKPVGLVYIAAARRGHASRHQRHVFTGDRQQVRKATALAAMDLLKELLGDDEA